MMMTVCGVDCETCGEYQKSCAGCDTIKGKIFWASMVGKEVCPIYECAVTNQKFQNCASCEKLPCELYYSLKDPSISDEEHLKGVQKRVNVLKNSLDK